MKTLSFFAIVLFAGLLAGLIHGLINVAIVEPYLDKAIGLENLRKFESGETQNTPQFQQQFTDYRIWQKQGSIVAGAMLGVATGSLFGLVFAYSRNILPSQNYVTKSLILTGIMWATLYFIPFLKYPANPPTVGDPNTIVFRAVTYIVFVAISGLGALAFSRLYKRMKNKKFVAFVGYAGFMVIMFVIMPPNPDTITTPMDLVNGFRAISAVTMTVSWIVNGVILGLLWKRFQPHIENQVSKNS
ncbi:MAG TPA: CbtA family protein [Candidatus Nitrosotalea sp.]|nr:CbtA family protein [Candidatus Nitrosotalea sp.]